MKKFSKSIIYFFIGFAILFALPLLFIQKGDIVLAMNKTYTSINVLFFRAVNMLGDGIAFAYIGVFYLLFSFRRTIFLAFMIIIQTIIVRFFKDGIAQGMPRPYLFFQDMGITIETADMVNVHHLDTFPSGHATTAFTIALFFMLQLKNSRQQMMLFIPFVLAAFARVYLAQHFYVDIVAAFLVAIVTMLVSQVLYYRFNVQNVRGSIVKLLFKKEPHPILVGLE